MGSARKVHLNAAALVSSVRQASFILCRGL